MSTLSLPYPPYSRYQRMIFTLCDLLRLIYWLLRLFSPAFFGFAWALIGYADHLEMRVLDPVWLRQSIGQSCAL